MKEKGREEERIVISDERYTSLSAVAHGIFKVGSITQGHQNDVGPSGTTEPSAKEYRFDPAIPKLLLLLPS